MQNILELKKQINQKNLEKVNLRHLILGASGQVGSALLRTIHNKGEEIIGTYNNTLLSCINNEIPPGRLFKLDLSLIHI